MTTLQRADNTLDKFTTSGLVADSSARARMGENTRISRDLMTPQAGVIGGTGDKDMRRLYDPVLQGQVLVQRGMNGWQSGALAINMQPNTYADGLPFVLQNASASMWGQSMLGAGVYPFLHTLAGAPTCGSSSSPSHQELYCPVPGSNWNVPPVWPGVKHSTCGSGSWGGSGSGSGGTATTPFAYQPGDPAPSAAPTSFYGVKFDANTIQFTWITSEQIQSSYTGYTHADVLSPSSIVLSTGFVYVIKQGDAPTGPFTPIVSIDLQLPCTISASTVYPIISTVYNRPALPSEVDMYYNYLFEATAGHTYYFVIQSTNPAGASPESSVISITM